MPRQSDASQVSGLKPMKAHSIDCSRHPVKTIRHWTACCCWLCARQTVGSHLVLMDGIIYAVVIARA